MNRPKIIGIGELVWDLLPSGRQLGGAPVNFAFWCNRLGSEGYPVSAIGRDELADAAMEALSDTGLDLSFMQHNEYPTGRVHVTLSGEGIPAYDIVESVAWDALQADSRTLELAACANAVCWGSLAQRAETSRKTILALIDAAPERCLKVFDINIRQQWYTPAVIRESLMRADILKLNEDELPLVARMFDLGEEKAGAIKRLVGRFDLRYVVYTAGSSHSEIHDGSGMVSSIPTPKVEVVDTVGAGDSFTAAFVTSLLQGASIDACHRKAVEVAASVCTIHGAIPRQ